MNPANSRKVRRAALCVLANTSSMAGWESWSQGGAEGAGMIYTTTLNAVGAASAVRSTGCWGQKAAAEPRRGIAT